jgi:hypothetical protein
MRMAKRHLLGVPLFPAACGEAMGSGFVATAATVFIPPLLYFC